MDHESVPDSVLVVVNPGQKLKREMVDFLWANGFETRRSNLIPIGKVFFSTTEKLKKEIQALQNERQNRVEHSR